jgi:hypothetical protein
MRERAVSQQWEKLDGYEDSNFSQDQLWRLQTPVIAQQSVYSVSPNSLMPTSTELRALVEGMPAVYGAIENVLRDGSSSATVSASSIVVPGFRAGDVYSCAQARSSRRTVCEMEDGKWRALVNEARQQIACLRDENRLLSLDTHALPADSAERPVGMDANTFVVKLCRDNAAFLGVDKGPHVAVVEAMVADTDLRSYSNPEPAHFKIPSDWSAALKKFLDALISWLQTRAGRHAVFLAVCHLGKSRSPTFCALARMFLLGSPLNEALAGILPRELPDGGQRPPLADQKHGPLVCKHGPPPPPAARLLVA